jgi:O-acetyl-ADP-ribose deacetylase (regulator of RNase III)
MIRYVKGNLFESSAQTIINTVNLKGVMGKGLALQFKDRFPGLFGSYVNDVLDKKIQIGSPTIWKGPEKWVINFPTKDDWRKPSEYSYIEKGLAGLRGKLDEWGVLSLALPPLGCGLGSLDWNKVKPMIEDHLGDLDMSIEVFEP